MNAFAWTTVVVLALGWLGWLCLIIAWLTDSSPRRIVTEPEELHDGEPEPKPSTARDAGQILLSAAIGLIAGAIYALGYAADLPAWLR